MESTSMDFRAQRYRDRLRAEGRAIAIRTARRTRDLLDRYVAARRRTEHLEPEVRVLWGRIFFVLLCAGLIVYALIAVAS